MQFHFGTRLGSAALGLLIASSVTAADPVLPGTKQLTLDRPVAEWMVAGINRFCLRELGASPQRRNALWKRNFDSARVHDASIAGNRKRFRSCIGAVDTRQTSLGDDRYGFELLATAEQSSAVAGAGDVTAHLVRWQVLDGVTAEGLLLVPGTIRAAVVAIPDADWTPEMFCGISGKLPVRVQLARHLASAGCLVAVPMLISRSDRLSGSPHVHFTNQPHREFIYRQAFEMGRHLIGYEVQKVLAAVDLFEQWQRRRDQAWPIGLVGVGEGGLLALYAAALDTRIASTLVCGYFQPREGLWREPIYRNVWSLLTEFGDAEIAGMIAPRNLVIEACSVPTVKGPPAVRTGRRQSAAPGTIRTPAIAAVESEFARAAAIYSRLRQPDRIVLVTDDRGNSPAGNLSGLTAFQRGLKLAPATDSKPARWRPATRSDDTAGGVLRSPQQRQARQFHELQRHVQGLLRLSSKVRDKVWHADTSSVEAWRKTADRLRHTVHEELIGRIPSPKLPANPRSRLLLSTRHYTGYEVVLDVFPDVIAGGILLLPRDLKPGEKRPVVVCQHGLEGTAMDTISRKPGPYAAYKAFGDELCRRGFIVFAPQNPYRGGDRFRSIQRKSNPLKRSLYSYIIPQHEQILDWLATLPQVDPKRIAFYGLSYGGKTAMRVPPFVRQYCLSICSGDFTDWVTTIAGNKDRYNYIFTGEYEIFEWNMGHVANYSDLAKLMTPRPFMVEQGYRDGGAPPAWVAAEFARVRQHYDQLDLADRVELEFFDGPHTIHGQGTFRFLHRHLQWPEPADR